MKRRSAGWLAWSLWALTMVLEVTAIWLWLGNHSRGGGYFAPQVFLVPGFATVGALIVARRANTVGWLFVGLGLLAASHAVTMAYGEWDTLIDPASLPAGSLVGSLVGWLWPLNYLLLCLQLRYHRGEGKQASQADPAMTPCMPCSFGPSHSRRSGAGRPAQRPSRVTVVDRWIPPVTAVCGTRLARPARTTMLASRATAPARPGSARG